jgi:hypothetical protein
MLSSPFRGVLFSVARSAAPPFVRVAAMATAHNRYGGKPVDGRSSERDERATEVRDVVRALGFPRVAHRVRMHAFLLRQTSARTPRASPSPAAHFCHVCGPRSRCARVTMRESRTPSRFFSHAPACGRCRLVRRTNDSRSFDPACVPILSRSHAHGRKPLLPVIPSGAAAWRMTPAANAPCEIAWPIVTSNHHRPGRGRYFSLRQFTEPRFSTVLDSISMSKPLRSRYFNVTTWPVPSSETP